MANLNANQKSNTNVYSKNNLNNESCLTNFYHFTKAINNIKDLKISDEEIYQILENLSSKLYKNKKTIDKIKKKKMSKIDIIKELLEIEKNKEIYIMCKTIFIKYLKPNKKKIKPNSEGHIVICEEDITIIDEIDFQLFEIENKIKDINVDLKQIEKRLYNNLTKEDISEILDFLLIQSENITKKLNNYSIDKLEIIKEISKINFLSKNIEKLEDSIRKNYKLKNNLDEIEDKILMLVISLTLLSSFLEEG